MFTRILVVSLGLAGLLSTSALAKIDYPQDLNDCPTLNTHMLQQDAKQGMWRFYHDPFTPTHCLLISYQQDWDHSKPTHLQVMPTQIPRRVIPFLTQHSLLDMTLPEQGVKINWLHLGYADDREAYQHYMAILSQPALRDRVNEVMAWRHLVSKAPRPAQFNAAEYLVYQDVAVSLLLAYPDVAKSGATNLDAVAQTRNAELHYRYIDALQRLRIEQASSQAQQREVQSFPRHLPPQATAVYERVRHHFNKMPLSPVLELADALSRAEQLVRAR